MSRLNDTRDAIISRLGEYLENCDVKPLPKNPDNINLECTHKFATCFVGFNGASGDDREVSSQMALERWNVYVCIKSLGIVENGYKVLDDIIAILSNREFEINGFVFYWTNTTARGYDTNQWFFDIDFILPQMYEY